MIFGASVLVERELISWKRIAAEGKRIKKLYVINLNCLRKKENRTFIQNIAASKNLVIN